MAKKRDWNALIDAELKKTTEGQQTATTKPNWDSLLEAELRKQTKVTPTEIAKSTPEQVDAELAMELSRDALNLQMNQIDKGLGNLKYDINAFEPTLPEFPKAKTAIDAFTEDKIEEGKKKIRKAGEEGRIQGTLKYLDESIGAAVDPQIQSALHFLTAQGTELSPMLKATYHTLSEDVQPYAKKIANDYIAENPYLEYNRQLYEDYIAGKIYSEAFNRLLENDEEFFASVYEERTGNPYSVFKKEQDAIATQELQKIKAKAEAMLVDLKKKRDENRTHAGQSRSSFGSVYADTATPYGGNIELVEGLIENIDDALEGSFSSGFDKAFDWDRVVTSGISGLLANKNLNISLEAQRQGKPMTDEMQSYVDIYGLMEEVEGLRGMREKYAKQMYDKWLGFNLNEIGSGIGSSAELLPTFAIGMGATSRIGSFATLGTKAAMKAAFKAGGKETIKYGVNTAGKLAYNYGLAKTRGYLIAPVSAYTYNQYFQSLNSGYSFDENGELTYKPVDKGQAYLGAIISSANEVSSEYIGLGFSKVVGMGARNVGRALAGSKLAGLVKPLTQWMPKLSPQAKHAMFMMGVQADPISETLSEAYGDMMTAYEQSLIGMEVDPSQFYTLDYWTTLFGVTLGYGGALSVAGGVATYKQVKDATKVREQILGQIDRRDLHDALVAISATDDVVLASAALAGLMRSLNLNVDEMRTARAYIVADTNVKILTGEVEENSRLKSFQGTLERVREIAYQPTAGEYSDMIQGAELEDGTPVYVINGLEEGNTTGLLTVINPTNGEKTSVAVDKVTLTEAYSVDEYILNAYSEQFSLETEQKRVMDTRNKAMEMTNPSDEDVARVASMLNISIPKVGNTVVLTNGIMGIVSEKLSPAEYALMAEDGATYKVNFTDILSSDPLTAKAQTSIANGNTIEFITPEEVTAPEEVSEEMINEVAPEATSQAEGVKVTIDGREGTIVGKSEDGSEYAVSFENNGVEDTEIYTKEEIDAAMATMATPKTESTITKVDVTESGKVDVDKLPAPDAAKDIVNKAGSIEAAIEGVKEVMAGVAEERKTASEAQKKRSLNDIGKTSEEVQALDAQLAHHGEVLAELEKMLTEQKAKISEAKETVPSEITEKSDTEAQSESVGLIRNEAAMKMTDKVLELVDDIGKKLGVTIEFVDNLTNDQGQRVNGDIVGKKVRISTNGSRGVRFIIGHEFFHRVKDIVTPEQYAEFVKTVKDFFSEDVWNGILETHRNTYRQHNARVVTQALADKTDEYIIETAQSLGIDTSKVAPEDLVRAIIKVAVDKVVTRPESSVEITDETSSQPTPYLPKLLKLTEALCEEESVADVAGEMIQNHSLFANYAESISDKIWLLRVLRKAIRGLKEFLKSKDYTTAQKKLNAMENALTQLLAEAETAEAESQEIERVEGKKNNAVTKEDAGENRKSIPEENTPAKTQTITNEKGDVVADINEATGQARFSIGTYKMEGRSILSSFLNKRVTEGALKRAEALQMLNDIDAIYDVCVGYKDQYAPFGAWSDAKVEVDDNGNPVFSVIKANGDYAMNLDFSLVCKKRRTLDAVLNEMIRRGMVNTLPEDPNVIAKINDVIRKHGFETACRLCFVDAKRFRVVKVANDFVHMYNDLVDMLIPKGKKIPVNKFSYAIEGVTVEGGLETIPNEELNIEVLETIGYKKIKGKDGKMRLDGSVMAKIARHLLDNPQDRRYTQTSDFVSTLGFDNVSAKNPKLLSLYNSKKGSGGPKASFSDVQYLNDIITTSWDAEAAYAVGGVRLQSFSDYVPRMVFDYIQMIADLAAKGLPVHAYTKEPLFAKTFGLTGVKINLSLVPKVVEGGVAAGLDAEGNYAWQEGETFPYEEAVAIQNAEGYKNNCGTIAVGVSDAHILKMLDDPNIRMIIPYHKSGLAKRVAVHNQIDKFKDYTNVQNTRKGGKKVTDDGLKGMPNFNEEMRKTNDPRKAATAYLDWCKSKGYTPKFDKFANHPNYYKLLEDFSTLVDEVYMPQEAVKFTFPTEENAFGSLETLIEQGLEEDAILEGQREAEVGAIVDELENVRFSIIGEVGASALDMAEEDTGARYSLQGDVASILDDYDTDGVEYSSVQDIADGIEALIVESTEDTTELENILDDFRAAQADANKWGHRMDSGGEKEFEEALRMYANKATLEERSGADSHNSSSEGLPLESSERLSGNALASPKDVAKIGKNTEVTHRAAKNIINEGGLKKEIKTPAQAVSALGKGLHMEKSDSSQSYYGDFFEGDYIVDEKVVHIRISTHPATPTLMGNAEADHKVSIVIRKNGEHKSDGTPHNGYTEYTYDPSVIAPKDAANAVIKGVKTLLETGEYVDETKKAVRKDYPYIENGETKYSLITPEMDASYLDAVERGDMETAQRMVMEAAKLAMPNTKVVDEDGNPKVVYHQTNASVYINRETGQNWDELDWRERMEWDERDDWDDYWEEREFNTFSRVNARTTQEFDGFFFAPEYDEYHEYGERTIEAFLNIENPASRGDYNIDSSKTNAGRDERIRLQNEGYDGVIREEDGTIWEYVAFNPNQIKSADPVTYDDNGNVIPLSERFNPEREDIRYSLIGEKGVISLENNNPAGARLRDLNIARQMEKRGEDALKIKVATGWERGVDGLWRYEIDDMVTVSNVNKLYEHNGDKAQHLVRRANEEKSIVQAMYDGIFNINEEVRNSPSRTYEERIRSIYNRYKDASKMELLNTINDLSGKINALKNGGSAVSLEDVIGRNHPIFAAYPEMRSVGVITTKDNGGETRGSYNWRNNTITISIYTGDIETEAETLVHEMQHAIQHIEGFATGGMVGGLNPHAVAKKKALIDEYTKKNEDVKKRKSELEARNVEIAKALNEWKNTRQEGSETPSDILSMINEESANKNAISALRSESRRLERNIDEHKEMDTRYSYDDYLRIAGEVEARTVAKRNRYTSEQRRNTLAVNDSYIAPEHRILVHKGDIMSPKYSEMAPTNEEDIKPTGNVRFSLQSVDATLMEHAESVKNLCELARGVYSITSSIVVAATKEDYVKTIEEAGYNSEDSETSFAVYLKNTDTIAVNAENIKEKPIFVESITHENAHSITEKLLWGDVGTIASSFNEEEIEALQKVALKGYDGYSSPAILDELISTFIQYFSTKQSGNLRLLDGCLKGYFNVDDLVNYMESVAINTYGERFTPIIKALMPILKKNIEINKGKYERQEIGSGSATIRFDRAREATKGDQRGVGKIGGDIEGSTTDTVYDSETQTTEIAPRYQLPDPDPSEAFYDELPVFDEDGNMVDVTTLPLKEAQDILDSKVRQMLEAEYDRNTQVIRREAQQSRDAINARYRNEKNKRRNGHKAARTSAAKIDEIFGDTPFESLPYEVQALILIATGQAKIYWGDRGGKRGLASELGLKGSTGDRHAYRNIWGEAKKSFNEVVHDWWESIGGQESGIDDNDLRNALISALQSVQSSKDAMQELINNYDDLTIDRDRNLANVDHYEAQELRKAKDAYEQYSAAFELSQGEERKSYHDRAVQYFGNQSLSRVEDIFEELTNDIERQKRKIERLKAEKKDMYTPLAEGIAKSKEIILHALERIRMFAGMEEVDLNDATRLINMVKSARSNRQINNLSSQAQALVQRISIKKAKTNLDRLLSLKLSNPDIIRKVLANTENWPEQERTSMLKHLWKVSRNGLRVSKAVHPDTRVIVTELKSLINRYSKGNDVVRGEILHEMEVRLDPNIESIDKKKEFEDYADKNKQIAFELFRRYRELLGTKVAYEMASSKVTKQRAEGVKGSALAESMADKQVKGNEYLQQLQLFNQELESLIVNGKEEISAFYLNKENHAKEIRSMGINAVGNARARLLPDVNPKGKTKTKATLKKLNAWKNATINAPYWTFETVLAKIDKAGKSGKLYTYFMNQFTDSVDAFYERERKHATLLADAMAEFFPKMNGKLRNKHNLFTRVMRKADDTLLPTALSYLNNDNRRESLRLTISSGMYTIAMWRQPRYQESMRVHGITDAVIDNIYREISEVDAGYISLMDWVNFTLLPDTRLEYDQVYRALYGGSMAKEVNYFPAKVLHFEEVKLDEKTGLGTLSMSPSALKERTSVNGMPNLNMNYFKVLQGHLQNMDQWASFAQMREDLSTLLSSKEFKNRLNELQPGIKADGGGEGGLFNNLFRTSKIATGLFEVDYDVAMKFFSKAQQKWASANIAYRFWTAAKQIASIPIFAFYKAHDPRSYYFFVKALGRGLNPFGAVKRAMNLSPSLRHRWESKFAGLDVLMQETSKDDGIAKYRGLTKRTWDAITDFVGKVTKLGMGANAAVDIMACAVGVNMIYDYEIYKATGGKREATEEEKRDAIRKAEYAFNSTQQSSEGAYMSAIQMIPAASMYTVYMNASMAAHRKRSYGLEELWKSFTSKEYKQFITDEFGRLGLWKKRGEMISDLLQGLASDTVFVYMGSYGGILGMSLLFDRNDDDDDDDKEEYLRSFWIDAGLSMLNGYLFGGLVSSGIKKGEFVFNPALDELSEDIKKLLDDKGNRVVETAQILAQFGIGVDLKTFYNIVAGVQNALFEEEDGDYSGAFLKILNAPTGYIKAFVGDRREGESVEDYMLRIVRLHTHLANIEYKDVFDENGKPILEDFYSPSMSQKQLKELRKEAENEYRRNILIRKGGLDEYKSYMEAEKVHKDICNLIGYDPSSKPSKEKQEKSDIAWEMAYYQEDVAYAVKERTDWFGDEEEYYNLLKDEQKAMNEFINAYYEYIKQSGFGAN